MKHGRRTLAVRIMLSVLLLFAVGAGTSVFSARVEAGLDARTMAAQRALVTAQNHDLRALLDLVDMETALRGFTLTRSQRFLQPYAAGRAGLARELRALQPGAASRAFRTGVEQWLTEFAGPTLSMVAAGGQPLAVARGEAWQNQGRHLFDVVRLSNDRLVGHDQRAGYRAVAADARAKQQAVGLLALGAILAQILVLALVYFLLLDGTRAVTRLAHAVRSGSWQEDLVARTGGPPEVQAVAQEIQTFAARAASERAAMAGELAALRVREQEARVESAAQERLAQLRTDFLANMSHELRTPLNSIIGFSDLLLERGGLDPRQERFARNILDSGHHLLQLVNDLLDMAKIDAGRLDLQIQPCSAGAVAGEATASVAPQMEQKDIRCSFAEDGETTCIADAGRLRQALLNLLSNAYKFTDPGGEVAVRVVGSPQEVRIGVRDSGRGIPPEKLEDIFDEFTQVSQGVSRIAEGTGLGLALTRRLMHLMGGQVTVASDLGKGSEFTLVLPGVAATAWPDDGSPRLLVLEDDPSARDLVLAALEGMGITVRWASSGAMARALATSGQPGIALVDILLPDGNGLEVLRDIGEVCPQMRTVVTSIVEQSAPLPAGVCRWLVKPFTAADLREAIRKLLPDTARAGE